MYLLRDKKVSLLEKVIFNYSEYTFYIESTLSEEYIILKQEAVLLKVENAILLSSKLVEVDSTLV